jgi:hypothetical protein
MRSEKNRCHVERKSSRIRRVKFGAITLAILASLSASLAHAEDFKTINGKEYMSQLRLRVSERDAELLENDQHYQWRLSSLRY